MILTKIISGGQTGADQGALHGAKLAGIETGGTAPKGYWTENGESSHLLRGYGLHETLSARYPPRTRINVMNSDGTLIFGDPESRGSALTARYCTELGKPHCVTLWSRSGIEMDTISDVVQWIIKKDIKTLNVAGNRESRNLGIHDAVSRFIVNLVKELKKGQLS